MKAIIKLIPVLAGMLFILSGHPLHAERPTYDELIEAFYKKKAEAFERAKAEGKYVFLMAGRTTCSNCRGTLESIHTQAVQSILNDSYVIWYFDWETVKNGKTDTEGKNYVDTALDMGITVLPALYIIKPETDTEPETLCKFAWGKHSEAKLTTFLDIENQPVANESITLSPNKLYISENTLFISNNNANETITIYTISGQVVNSFHKKNTDETLSVKTFPKGVLIIKSSAGWSSKFLNK